ncbi:benenodin family lasso peptide [Luteimonas notoginsengisoli]|uniref:Benenodin family lasso peptide n=1 Tax=Luteimonas notoginsengisoli TaxID=1578200 RepID=A0ABV7UTL6_9GAMM
MNANESTRTDVQEDLIELGVASVETLGKLGPTDEAVFHRIMPGISEE